MNTYERAIFDVAKLFLRDYVTPRLITPTSVLAP